MTDRNKVVLSPEAREGEAAADAGRQAIWAVVHEVWQLLDDGETDSAGKTTVDQDRWQAVSDAMDKLEALVPDSEGPFWGGYPVNYFWPKAAEVFPASGNNPAVPSADKLRIAVEGIGKYVCHDDDCQLVLQAGPFPPRRCTCGMEKALAALKVEDAPAPKTYSCTSGLPEGTCSCYACHGG